MKLSCRTWFAGLVAIGITVAIAAKILWHPDAWPLPSATRRGDCTVRRGWTQAEVTQACGPADARGVRPKVLSGEPPGYFCSAPCEVRRGRIVFYDCKGGVDGVGDVDPGYTGGCVR